MPSRDDKVGGGQLAYARVHCPKHRKVFLTYKEYTRQLEMPGEEWRCPLCGQIAVFDSHWFEVIHSK